MRRTALALLTGFACAALLFVAAPAEACEKHREAAAAKDVDSDAKPAKTAEAAQPAKDQAPTQDGSVLKPVDEILSATCNCGGPSDCTCKKGECKCKKCSKHHQGVKKSELLQPLKGSQLSPVAPQNARNDATAGVFI